MRELLVEPKGIIETPNPYGQYPVGACLTAQNVVMRDLGIMAQAPALRPSTLMNSTTGFQPVAAIPFDNGNLLIGGYDTIAVGRLYAGGSLVSYLHTLGDDVEFSAAKLPMFRMRDRIFVGTENVGWLVADTVAPPSFPLTMRPAGLLACVISTVNPNSTNPIAFPDDTAATYSAIQVRKFSDGYEIASASATPRVFLNDLGGTFNTTITVRLDPYVVEGDVIEIYRSDLVFNAVATTDPGETCKLIARITLDAADIAAGFITHVDGTIPGVLGTTNGEQLYTNPNQRGAFGAHRIPPIAGCSAVFANYAFMGCITSRGGWKFQVPGGIGATTGPGWDTAAFRATGIGTREVAGVVTIGTNTITGVSATHMLGIVPGQGLNVAGVGGATFPANTEVISAIGTTITLNNNASASGTGAFIKDRIAINVAGNSNLNAATGFTSDRTLLEQLMQSMAPPHLEVELSENAVGLPDVAVAGYRQTTWTVLPRRITRDFPLEVRATNGQNYQAAVSEYSTGLYTQFPYVTNKNLLKWSNDGAPEHWPDSNETLVGSGEIIALAATRDALWIFCTDGLYRLSGAGGQWRIDLMDTTVTPCSPRSVCVLREAVYAYTNVGLVRITDAGVERLSSDTVSVLLPGPEYSETESIFVVASEQHDEIVIRTDDTRVIVYNAHTGTFTTVLLPSVYAMAYARYPAAGEPCVTVVQRLTLQTTWALWSATDSFLAMTVRFQPMFAGDPFSQKQWIDSSWICDVGSIAKSITPNWNGIDSLAVALKGGAQFFNESRALIGVPRRVAVGHTIAPGFALNANTTQAKFYALSLRYRQYGEAALHR